MTLRGRNIGDLFELLVILPLMVIVGVPFYVAGWSVLWLWDRLDPDVPRDARWPKGSR